MAGRTDAPSFCDVRRPQGGKTSNLGQDKTKTEPVGKRPANEGGDGERDMGEALRTVYQKTVEEQVPDEFMDLLGKLK